MKNIVYVSEKEVLIDGQKFVKEETKQPEFKVGQWFVWEETDELHRIVNMTGNRLWFINENDNNRKQFLFSQECRLATPQEIEAHLKKIFDEKYVGKKIKSVNDGHIGCVKSFFSYLNKQDMAYAEDDKGIIYFYAKGKFAEIIPDKKKLPKTKEEFNKFLGAFTNRHCSAVSDFLDQYED